MSKIVDTFFFWAVTTPVLLKSLLWYVSVADAHNMEDASFFGQLSIGNMQCGANITFPF